MSLQHENANACGVEHVCYMCKNDEEKWHVLSQFYQAGLDNNEKMMFFRFSTPEEEVIQRLEEGGITGIREYMKRGQFVVWTCADIYFNDEKEFIPESVCVTLSNLTNNVQAEGHSAIRVCGDMSWAHTEQSLMTKLCAYESMMNYGFMAANFTGLCMYDTRLFKPRDLLNVMTAHPLIMTNGNLSQNIYFMPPDTLASEDLERATLMQWLRNIEERKIIEQELIHARIKAESATHAKASFLAAMSHEIRNPTNGIIGGTEMLSQTPMTAEQTEYINIIQSSAKHLYTVVNDVLDFSKFDSGKLELCIAPINIAYLLEDSRRLCQYSIQKNLAVSLRCFFDSACPKTIMGDEQRLRQVLVNLIGNSYKFTQSGEVVVSVMPVVGPTRGGEAKGKEGEISGNRGEEDGKAEEVKVKKKEAKRQEEEAEEQKNYLEFSVSDTGVGISKENMAKLFTKFTQIDATPTTVGTGLGLVICKQLVGAMGGRIYIESEPGKGSTFYFRIPLKLPPVTDLPCLASSILRRPSLHLSKLPPSSSAFSVPPLSGTRRSSLSSSLYCSSGNLPAVIISPSSSPSGSPLLDVIPSPPEAILSRTAPITLSPPLSPLVCENSPAILSLDSPTLSPTHSSSLHETSDFFEDNVLIDDPINRKILCGMLERLRCRYSSATNGLEAIDLAKQYDFSLIITDQYMPICDGYTAVKQMRADYAASNRRCPAIVVCTGTYEERLKEVMDEVLVKPICFKTVSDLVLKGSAFNALNQDVKTF